MQLRRARKLIIIERGGKGKDERIARFASAELQAV